MVLCELGSSREQRISFLLRSRWVISMHITLPGHKTSYLRILPLLSDVIWNRGCSRRNSQHCPACEMSRLDIATSMCFQTSCIKSQQLQVYTSSTWVHNQASIGCPFAQRLASKLKETLSQVFHDGDAVDSTRIRFSQCPDDTGEDALCPCPFVWKSKLVTQQLLDPFQEEPGPSSLGPLRQRIIHGTLPGFLEFKDEV